MVNVDHKLLETNFSKNGVFLCDSKRNILDKSLDKNVLSILHQIKHYSNQKYEIAIKKWRAILSYSKELRDAQTARFLCHSQPF